MVQWTVRISPGTRSSNLSQKHQDFVCVCVCVCVAPSEDEDEGNYAHVLVFGQSRASAAHGLGATDGHGQQAKHNLQRLRLERHGRHRTPRAPRVDHGAVGVAEVHAWRRHGRQAKAVAHVVIVYASDWREAPIVQWRHLRVVRTSLLSSAHSMPWAERKGCLVGLRECAWQERDQSRRDQVATSSSVSTLPSS